MATTNVPARPAISRSGTASPQHSPAGSQINAQAGPSSSVRSNDDQRRARREQLRNFYNLKEAPAGDSSKDQAGQTSTKKEAIEDPLNIDSPAFDASAYYQDMIAKSSLSDLMKRAVDLSAEVGNLNSSRHSLVYNHHHQLFSAGDTIQLLNAHTPQLLNIVTSLQNSFSSISQLADSVSLPEPSPRAKNADEGQQGVERQIQRLKLMRIAEGVWDVPSEALIAEPPDRVEAVYTDLKPKLVELADGGDEQAGQLLRELRTL